MKIYRKNGGYIGILQDIKDGKIKDLTGADLGGADLSKADLMGADLSKADLMGADLSKADLTGANLRWVDLRWANLSNVDLGGADLSKADLTGANLRWVDLRWANLRRADLRWANLEDSALPHFQIVPEKGSFTGWKKLSNGQIAELRIPAKAKRTSTLIGRKCRCSEAKVVKLYGDNNGEVSTGTHYNGIRYIEGTVVKPDSYDDDIRIECTNGIHFFLTRKEAEEW